MDIAQDYQKEASERRQFKRVQLGKPVLCELENVLNLPALFWKSHFVAQAVDLSVGGVGLLLNGPLPAFARVRIKFFSTHDPKGECKHQRHAFMVDGEVCYCYSLRNGRYRCGISFGRVDKDKEIMFRKLV